MLKNKFNPLKISLERVTQKEIKFTELKKKLVEDEPLFEAQINYEDLEKSLIQTSKAVIWFVKKKIETQKK